MGGSGAGGSVIIRVRTASLGSDRVTALGGTRSIGMNNYGGAGGVGRIRIEYCDTFSGSTNPPASVAKINFCYGTVAGRVFRDNNGNGVQDAGEPGMSGVTVSLSGIGQKTTDGNGNYSFTANAPANYTVSVTPPAGYDCITPCSVNISLQVDQTTTVNFALRPRASISGKVFHDTNNNGVQDTGESGIAGVTVTLDGTGQTRTTAGDGSYSFDQLLPGNYSVSVTVPDGYVNTTPTTVSCNLGAGSVCTANFGILKYTIEKASGSEHQIRLFMPESFRSGRRYWVQYGRRMAFTGAGQQQAQVKLPKAHYGNATMDVLLVEPVSSNTFVQLNLDVGCDASSEWSKNANLAIPTTLSTSNLALGFNRFMAGAAPGADGLVTVPLCLSFNVAGRLYLTNLVATPDGISDVSIGPADVTLNPANPVEGDTVNVQATLHNASGYDSGGLTVSFYATAPDWGEWYIGSAFVPNVPAGGTAQASIQWNTLGFTGAVPVRVVVDPYNRVPELDETNNVATATLTIRTRPDLSIPAITLSDAAPVAGKPVTVTVTLRNNGETAAGTQTTTLYNGNPDAGGTAIGNRSVATIAGGATRAATFTWTPAKPGPYRLFARADRAGVVAESNESNNDAWRDVYVGLGGPIVIDAGAASDRPYSAAAGYGYLSSGTRTIACGGSAAPDATLRAAITSTLVYRFDHLIPGRFYHLDLTLRDCDGNRAEEVWVNGMRVAPAADLSDHQPHRLSLLLDPALYRDHAITVAIAETHGLDAQLAEISLHDVDYRYADAGHSDDPADPADPAYPGPAAAQARGRAYGWLDGERLATWGGLPGETVRMDRADSNPADDPDSELRYRFDGLDPARRYRLHLTFRQLSGAAVIQKVQIDRADATRSFTLLSGQAYSLTVAVPPTAYTADGSIIVGVVRMDCATSEAQVNEIALEEETLPPGNPCQVQPTPYRAIATGSVTVYGAPAPVGTVVEALNARDQVVGCTVVSTAGEYPLMQIYGEDPPTIPGMQDGEIVAFRVNGIPAVAQPPLYWRNDATPRTVNLSTGATEGQCSWLAPNWNLFSFRLDPLVPTVEKVLGPVAGRYCQVRGERAAYDCTLDPIYRPLKELAVGQGYYLKLEGGAGANLRIEGVAVPVTTPIPLHTYWNWVGYLPAVAQPITAALESIAGRYLLVLSKDKTYDPNNPARSTLWTLGPGQGYQIRATQAVTLVYPSGASAAAAPDLGKGIQDAITAACPDLSPTPFLTLLYGQARLGAAPAPAGAVVEIVTPRGDVAGCTVVRADGEYGYVHVYGEDATDPPIPGFRPGEPLAFRVNGRPVAAAPDLAWQNDRAPHEVNLAGDVWQVWLPLLVK